MSLLKSLPSIRSRASLARRASFAPFSSTASTSAGATGTSQPPGILDALRDPANNSRSQPQAYDVWGKPVPPVGGVAEAAVVEDGPPLPPPESYPRSMNPVAAANKVTRAAVGQEKPLYAVSVKATRNNTIVTFARPGGDQLVTLTGGKLGFKKSNRNGYEAGYQCAVGIIGAMEEQMKKVDFEWELLLKGFGSGREAMLTAITTSVGANVKDRLKRVTDRTPIKIGGTRGKKARRI